MVFVVLAAIGLFLGVLHVAIRKQPRTKQRVADVLLLYLFAASIGWSAGNPFQYEVAVANLAFGILGLLCLQFRDSFWTATAIGWSIFVLGAAGVHLHQIRIGQPYAPANAGAVLYFDILMPVLVIALLRVRKARK